MKQEERDFEQRCRRAARLAGWIAFKVEKNGHKGIPDDLFMSSDGRRFVFVEFKKDIKIKPRAEQKLWLDRFPETCFLVGDFDTFCKILDL